MNEPNGSPVPYRVIYSERVRTELKALVTRAASRGFGRQVLDAVKEIDARLRVYPQFGEPLRDLTAAGETLWAGVISPLIIQYIIDEPRRLVFVVVPLRPLPQTGL